MDTTQRNRISQLLGTMANVQGHEIKAVVGSFLFVVLLMSAYYILRPVRDAMASDWSDAEVSWLWTLNFFISTAVVALYGALVARFPLRLLGSSARAIERSSARALKLGMLIIRNVKGLSITYFGGRGRRGRAAARSRHGA